MLRQTEIDMKFATSTECAQKSINYLQFFRVCNKAFTYLASLRQILIFAPKQTRRVNIIFISEKLLANTAKKLLKSRSRKLSRLCLAANNYQD